MGAGALCGEGVRGKFFPWSPYQGRRVVQAWDAYVRSASARVGEAGRPRTALRMEEEEEGEGEQG